MVHSALALATMDDEEAVIDPIPVLPHLPPPAAAEDGGVVVVDHPVEHHQSWQQPELHHDNGQQQHQHPDATATAAALLADETTAGIIPTLPQLHHHDDGGAAVASMPAGPYTELLKRDAEQGVTITTLHHHEHHKEQAAPPPSKRQKTHPTTKKDRQEFTAAEKLRILKELEGSRQNNAHAVNDLDPHHHQAPPPPPQPTLTIKQLREKYGVSKSSLHRWRQQKHRLEIMVASEGLGNRKRDTKDPLEKIKIGLQKFYNENMMKNPEERLIVTTPVVQAMACKIREELLAEYDAIMADAAAAVAVGDDGGQMAQQLPQPNLNEEELTAIREFKITKSWAGRVASSMGWLSQPRRKNDQPQQTQQQQQQQQVQEHQMTHVDGIVREDTATAVPVAAIAPDGTTTTTDVMTEEESNAEKAKLNTLAFLSQTHPDYSVNNPKAKKTRKEFTAAEKIAIIAEMDPQQTDKPLSMAEICERHSTSKSSVFRWKQQLRAGILTQMVNEEGRGNFKRDVADKLGKLKLRLRDFIEDNRAQPVETRLALTGVVLQTKAQEFRDELMARHDADPSKSNLKEDEVEALRKFKASKGWARKAAARFGWKDVEDQVNTSYAGGGTVGGGGVGAEDAAAAAAAVTAASVAAAGDQDTVVSSSNKQLDKNTAQQFSIQVCTSTNCCRKMNQLGLDQYHILGEIYEKARLANIEKDMIVEDGGCRGGKNCRLGPCVAVMHEDFVGSVALEGMVQSEFNERVFHGVATQDDVERVWSCITNAIELMTDEASES